MSKRTTGFVFAILDMITYGLLPVVSHYFVATIDPLVFSGAATLIGSLPLLVWQYRKKTIHQLYSRTYFPNLMGLAMLTTVASICYFFGTRLTSGLNTGLLTQMEPLYALAIGIFILHEAVGIHQILAVLLMMVGAIVIVYKGATGLNIGDILILSSPLASQLSHLFAKRVYAEKADTNVVPLARMLYSGILLLVIAAAINPTSLFQLFSLKTLIIVTTFGLIFRFLDLLLWYQAIARISISKASSVIPLAVAVSLIGSLVFLKETVSSHQLIGLFFILGGLLWLSKIHLSEGK
ncbi:DMT family transporter [Candidatus Roizmanbacteria bacterium]|nr:DMT family transporter [Candidatus Roizmanbacteria bacterium]